MTIDTATPERQNRYIEPASLIEAEERLLLLKQRKSEIEVQLGDRDRRHPDGQRLDGEEYWAWRHSAIYAKGHAEREILELKRWIRDEKFRGREESRQIRAEMANVNLNDPLSLIAGAHRLLGRLGYDGVQFSDEERSLIASLRYSLRQSHVPPDAGDEGTA